MCHVLIIEDEPFTAMIIEDVLGDEGATSFAVAATEEEAVVSAMTQLPALITSDVALLEGTGPRAVERIHGELGDIPVIFITGTPQDCDPCAPPGRLLSKPVNPQVVARTFHELLSG